MFELLAAVLVAWLAFEAELLLAEFNTVAVFETGAGVEAFDTVLVVLVFDLLALALVLLAAPSPQAAPRAPIARTAESAITFFI
jgi:hypothetical protein